MSPARWFRKHGFRKVQRADDSYWDRAEVTLRRVGDRWKCAYKDVTAEVPLLGQVVVQGSTAYGKSPRIAMARCHNDMWARLANPRPPVFFDAQGYRLD